jgi:hypothetical protein
LQSGIRSLFLSILLVVQEFDSRELLSQAIFEILTLILSDSPAFRIDHRTKRYNFCIGLQQFLNELLTALGRVGERASSNYSDSAV